MPKDTFINLPDDKRQRIIDATLEEFAAHTYHRASLSQIVSRAGIAKGSMYQYFENKFDLYLYVLGMLGSSKAEAIKGAVEELGSEADVFDVLRTAVRAAVEWARSEPRLVALGMNLLKETDPEIMAGVMAHFRPDRDDLLGGWLRDGARRGQLDPSVDPAIASQVVAVLLESMNGQIAAGVPLEAVMAYADRVLDIVEHGMRPSTGRDGRQES